MIRVLCVAVCLAGPVTAQGITLGIPDEEEESALTLNEPAAPLRETVTESSGAVLRALDKVDGETIDIDIDAGATAEFGRLKVTLAECRYPSDDPSSNAYALMRIDEENEPEPRFTGWMIANAPALNPLDHPRYDVWVMRCITS